MKAYRNLLLLVLLPVLAACSDDIVGVETEYEFPEPKTEFVKGEVSKSFDMAAFALVDTLESGHVLYRAEIALDRAPAAVFFPELNQFVPGGSKSLLIGDERVRLGSLVTIPGGVVEFTVSMAEGSKTATIEATVVDLTEGNGEPEEQVAADPTGLGRATLIYTGLVPSNG